MAASPDASVNVDVCHDCGMLVGFMGGRFGKQMIFQFGVLFWCCCHIS